MFFVDLEDITAHYARTLKIWRENFFKQLPKIKELGFSDSFIKLKMEEWHSYTAHFSEWEKRNTLDI